VKERLFQRGTWEVQNPESGLKGFSGKPPYKELSQNLFAGKSLALGKIPRAIQMIAMERISNE
jgi:hypothetical protein